MYFPFFITDLFFTFRFKGKNYICTQLPNLHPDMNQSKSFPATNYFEDYIKEHDELVSKKQEFTPTFNPQWTNKGDYFVKFSLYPEQPSGKTTSNTSINFSQLDA